MPIVPVRGLGKLGVLPDVDKYDVGLSGFTDAQNVRTENGKLIKATGWQQAHDLEGVLYMVQWSRSDGDAIIAVTSTHIWLFQAWSNPTDITPQEGVVPGKWTHCVYGQWLILVNDAQGKPIAIKPSENQMSELPSWPSTLTCKQIVSFNGFLIALNLVDSGSAKPFALRWSSDVDPETLSTSWDISDPTTLAGEVPLVGGDGDILGAQSLGHMLIVFMQQAAFALQYIGGAYVFSNRKLFDDDGAIVTDAWAEYSGQQLVVGQHGIYSHDGNRKTQLSDGRITRDFISRLANPKSIKVARHAERSEIWICFADRDAADDTKANAAWVYNYADNTWTPRQLPNITSIVSGIRLNDEAVTWDTWGANLTWATLSGHWDTINPQSHDPELLIAGDAIYRADDSYLHGNENMTAFARQEKLDLDELTGESGSVKIIRAVWPQIDGKGQVKIRVGGSMSPQGSIKWGKPVSYDIANGDKVDVRAAYRYLALEITQDDGGYFELSGWDLDVQVAYGR